LPIYRCYHTLVDIPWEEARLFLAVAESKSLSAAARLLHANQPTLSRRIAQLEARVGEPLFARSVAGMNLTAHGERLLEPARHMARWAAELGRAAAERASAPSGVVRVTAPPGIAGELLAPFAAFLRQALPSLRLEVIATPRYLDIARREADLALRFARPPQRDVVPVAELSLPVAAYASPNYAATLKKGHGFEDVRWIAWAPPLDDVPPNPQLQKRIPGFVPAFASDDFLVQLRAAEAGAGAIVLARLRPQPAARDGLRPLDLDLKLPPARLYLVSSRGALDVPRVRAVADLLAAELRHRPTRRAR
jgi:DNA-binding transcriptional LysR family regulator